MIDNLTYSYGQQLKSARERNGLSLQAVADALRLEVNLIEAIELEDQSLLPAPAYVRGYIRAYAQLVKCEPDTLVASYNTYAKSDPQLIWSVPSLAALEEKRDAHFMWVGTGITASIVLIVVGGWLLLNHLGLLDVPFDRKTETIIPQTPIGSQSIGPGSTSMELPLPSLEDSADIPSPEATGTVDAATAEGTEVESSSPVGEAGSFSTLPDMAGGTASTVESVVVNSRTGDDRLSLGFQGMSWAEVLDANGYRLIYGLFGQQTQTLSVQGKAPFQVIVGDATQVNVSVNGKAFDFNPYIRRDKTARFKVGMLESQQE